MKILSLNKKKIVVLLLAAILIAVVGGVTLTTEKAYAQEETETISIVHLSDLHVMIEEYCNLYSEKYNAATKSTKLLAETSIVCEGVLEEIYNMANPPKYIFLTGDLTSNGEYENHVWVSNLLKSFTKKMRAKPGCESFQIFVSPGNHDIYNCNAKSYMPTRRELIFCESTENFISMEQYLTDYKPRSVETVTSKQFMDLYADFGYCSCPDRANGHHLASCGMAEGCAIEYFFESDYWYDDDTDRSGAGLEVTTPSDETLDAFNSSDKDYNILSADARFGACSYIARMDGVSILSFDSNCRSYKYDKEEKRNTAAISASGWHETTGGMVSENQLKWALSSLQGDISQGNTVFTLGHTNFIPHFDTEDEVISLFTYDNWEQATYTLADAGIHYSFTGHQHAADIVNYTTQNGNVFYDIETGSLSSYGCSWRSLTFTKTTTDDNFTEDMTSLVHNYNASPFVYGTYKITETMTSTDKALTESPIALFKTGADELLTTSVGDGALTLVKTVSTAENGETIGISDLLAEEMYALAGSIENGMAGEYVGNNLCEFLKEATADISQILYSMANTLEGVYLCKFSYDGNDYDVTEEPVEGYGIDDLSLDLASFLIQYDFSFGKNERKLTLADALMIIYGGHLSGAHGEEVDEEIKPLLEFLENGGFVDFLITLLEDSLLPQLDLILDAPIRFNSESMSLLRSGFDIVDELEKSKLTVDGIVKLLQGLDIIFVNTDDNGYSSLRLVLKDIYDYVQDITTQDILDLLSMFIKDMDSSSIVTLLDDYFDMAKKYLGMVVNGESLRAIIDENLVDKYVTDAFCKNLGSYGAKILTDLDTDDTEDGSSWTSGNRYTRYAVKNVTMHITSDDCYNGHTYQSGCKVNVTPSAENGLLPSMISVSYNENIYTEKNVSWFTHIQTDLWDSDAVPEGYIRYSLYADMQKAKAVKASSENIECTLPTVDLGITFINLNHVTRVYNRYFVTLTDLTPGTKYYYQLGSAKYGWSDTYCFATASDGTFTFMAITDIQGSIEKNYTTSCADLEKAVTYIGKDEIAFIVSGGDNVDNGKNILQYTWMLDDQRSIWANNTLVSVAGNHEDENNALGNILALPDTATVSDTGCYYSYNYNMAHFIVLDTNDLEKDGTLGADQLFWLEEDLIEIADNEDISWTIVVMHKGMYTAGSHAFDDDVIALREQLTPLFYTYGVDLVLQGHDHTYSVSQFLNGEGESTQNATSGKYRDPDGVLYVNLGTMGDKYYDYIYHSDVTLSERNADKYDERLSAYFTDGGNLELTETPVFTKITVSEDNLVIQSYTIVNGEIVPVDDITITHKNNLLMTVLIAVGGAVLLTGISLAAIALIKLHHKKKAAKQPHTL